MVMFLGDTRTCFSFIWRQNKATYLLKCMDDLIAQLT